MATELKKFLDAKKTETRLLGDVERYLLRRTPPHRSTLVLHPSEIIKEDFCERYAYYLLNGGEQLKEKPNLRLQNVFDEGHYIHEKWQIRFQEMGVLYGKFQCQRCDRHTTGVSPACEHCGKDDAMVYQEVTLYDDALRIKGHTDGWIKGIGPDTLIEIKSVGAGTFRWEAPELLMDADNDVSRAFKNIRRPFRSHLLQGQMYLELTKRMYGVEAPNEIVFIYELKGDQSYKEFPVKADYEIVEHVFKKAERIVKAVEEGKMPECNNDPEKGCKQCNLIL
jgi:CRISPR/Cas system-associated exonuclease Cas4 (RecB family)